VADEGGEPPCLADRICEDCGTVVEPGAEHACEAKVAVRGYLLRSGASVEEIERATDDDALYGLAGDLVRRRGIEWMTVEDVATAAGVAVEDVERYRLLVGLSPGETMLPAWTVTGIGSYRLAASFAGEDGARDYVRVLAGAAARVAAASTALALNEVAPALHAAQMSTVEALELIEVMTTALITHTPQAFDFLFREHVLISGRRGRMEHEAELAHVAVGFVDLTGSTTWAEQVPHREYAAALARFEDGAWSATSSRGARLVKTIGDEAMLVASDPDAVVRAALDICAMTDNDPSLPSSRGAVGYGHVYAYGGDYYGPLVNLVARAVKVAAPGELVVTEPVAAALAATGFELGEPETHRLRGVDNPVELTPVTPSDRARPTAEG
jgi:class 3 adenylate cyclase